MPRAALEGEPGDALFTVAHEPRRLAFVAAGPRGRGWTAGKEGFDFYDLKGAIEGALEALGAAATFASAGRSVAWLHPRSACEVTVRGQRAGAFGELHPSLADALSLPRTALAGELDLDLLLDAATLVPRFRGLAKFPASLRDVAVVVDERVSAAEVLGEIARADAKGLVEETLLFDVYRGAPLPAGRKNLAFSLRFRAADRTLTDEEVNALHAAIVERLGQAFHAELRA
jgi:phenylalanyl-tRNA synthetase beta chain